MKTPFVIGVAGGTGSGKTTLSQEIKKAVPPTLLAAIPHDAYYKDQSSIPQEQRPFTNYDHPDSLETELLVKHLKELKKGHTITHPTYDFTTHTRSKKTITLEPKPIILVEGILIFAEPQLQELFDMKIFVDTDSDLRLARRIVRDVATRGRTFEEVIEQYLLTVKPMHEQFVEPSKKFADIIVPEGGFNRVAIDMIKSQIDSILATIAPKKPLKKTAK
mgnify:CR=1 FL=1